MEAVFCNLNRWYQGIKTDNQGGYLKFIPCIQSLSRANFNNFIRKWVTNCKNIPEFNLGM